MPDETVFSATQTALASFLKTVPLRAPRDEAEAKTYLAIAFMCGASIVASSAGKEAAKPFLDYANTLKQRYEGFRDMRDMGGVILPN